MILPDWARAHGASLYAASLRSEAADFDVTEHLGFEFTGDGEHDYLFVEKTGANTEWVSRQLAAHAEVPVRDVGYAGLKDRHAVTRQWFSIPRWNAPDWNRLAVDGVRLLEQRRHNRKLRRGAHEGNCFRIVLRGRLPDREALEARLQTIGSAGVPNYFGEQRFGRAGSNVELANAWSVGKRLARHKRSLAISTARSYLFNLILDKRVRDRTWNRIIAGDVANLDGSGSVFDVYEVDDVLIRRCEAMDIHPAGPLVGVGSPVLSLSPEHEAWRQALEHAKVKGASRSLRLRVSDLSWTINGDAVTLEFILGPGAYATSLLREIAEVHDATRSVGIERA